MPISKLSPEGQKHINELLEHWEVGEQRSNKRNTELAKNLYCPRCGDLDWHRASFGWYCMKCGHEERRNADN